MNDINYWQKKLYREFSSQPGQHMGVTGRTGAGKTNYMKWLLHSELEHRNHVPISQWETLVWFDIGKASEVLGVCCGLQVPCRLLIPEMMDVHIELFDQDSVFFDVEKIYISSEKEIWTNLSRDRINIVCFEGFIRDTNTLVPFLKKTFATLIELALSYKLRAVTPMRIYYDEFHNICPSKGNAASPDIYSHGGDIQLNFEKLRGHKIGFVAGMHKWTGLRAGVRSSLMLISALPGANFPTSEQPKLSRFNRKFESLRTGQVIIAYADKTLSGVLNIPRYPDGEDFGYVYYKTG